MQNKRKRKNSQKHFRKIPDIVQVKLNNFASDNFVVACVRKISTSEITAGDFSNIGISIVNGKLDFPDKQIPAPSVGRFSKINVQGFEIVRRDLPKVTKNFSMDVPNFGDWSKGSHEVIWSREVYQRDLLFPKELELEIELIGEEVSTETDEKLFIFKFTISETLNRQKLPAETTYLIKNNLFFNLNLLQECCGASDVFVSTATRADYLKSLYVSWEILPVGEKEATVDRILAGVKAPTPELRRKISERYDFLLSLKPKDFIKGTSGLRRYFGALFSDNLVVFEHLEYGNALYAMFENWKALSQLTRPQLLSGDRTGFVRIEHRRGWEEKLSKLVDERRERLAA